MTRFCGHLGQVFILSAWWMVHREVYLQGVHFFALWKCVWKGQQHMDLACPRHGCGSLGTFCACSKCRKKGGGEWSKRLQWAVWWWQWVTCLWTGAAGGPSHGLVFITAEVRNRPHTMPLPCLMGHSRIGKFSWRATGNIWTRECR